MTAGAEPEDVKPKLNLIVMFNERSIRLQVKGNTQFKKIFQTAYAKFNQAPGTIRFTYEGKRIQAQDTPLDHEMEDGDQIDAQVEQIGGVCHWRSFVMGLRDDGLSTSPQTMIL